MMHRAIETPLAQRDPFAVPEGNDFYSVVDEDGNRKSVYPTMQQAQKRADALNADVDREDTFSIFFDEYFETTIASGRF